MNIAQITVSGNIGQQPEIKDVGNGKVANFSVAVNDSYKDKAGNKVEKTQWFDVEAWDSTAGKGLVSNVIEPYCSSGTTVYMQGSPLIEQWTDKDGIKRKGFKIKLAGAGSTFRLIGNKDGNSNPSAPKASNDTGSEKVDVKDDDEIPF